VITVFIVILKLGEEKERTKIDYLKKECHKTRLKFRSKEKIFFFWKL